MITLHYYLDARAVSAGRPAPLKLCVTKHGAAAMMKTGIALLPSEWDAHEQKVVNSPRRKALNTHLARLKIEAEDYILRLLYDGKLAGLSSIEVRDILAEHFQGETRKKDEKTFAQLFEMAASTVSASTAQVQTFAARSLQKLLGEKGWNTPVTSINDKWVANLDAKIKASEYSQNSVNIILTRLHYTWNSAKRSGIVVGDPFANLKAKAVKTRNRDFTVEQLRLFMTAPAADRKEALALDFFSLSFFLIAINPVDLCEASPSDIYNGRLAYTRSKTKKVYSIKVIDEAWEIIRRRGDESHIFSIGKVNYRYFNVKINSLLRERAKRLGLPDATMYWARHSWASLAYELGTSIELVSAALGHSYGAAITMGYVDIKQRQVDEVNRRVVDYVLGK